MEKRNSKTQDKLKLLFMTLYFVILTAERIISLVICFTRDISTLDALDYYMIALTILAIFASYIFAVMRFSGMAKRRNDKSQDENSDEPDLFGGLSVAAGILLLGGMVHTEGSIPVMQFVSYGMILVSMAIHTIQNVNHHKNADKKWMSFAYTVAYSMAIPVVYHTTIDLAYLFIPVEIVVSAGMVVLFTIMLRRFYICGAQNEFSLPPFIAALFGDFLVLMLRWHEEINVFVLIFICVTTVLWFAGNMLCIKKK